MDATKVEPVGRRDTEAAERSQQPWHPATTVCLLFAQVMLVFTGIVGRWLPDHAVSWQMIALGAAHPMGKSTPRGTGLR